MKIALTAPLVALFCLGPALAQEAAAPAPQPPPCSGPEYRQFDFWAGEWDVVPAQPKKPNPQPSHSRITVILGGCVVKEEYSTPGGYEGTSLSYYDAASKAWKQTWVDNQGAPVIFSGGFEDGRMVLDEAPDGNIRGRISWTPLPDGRVRQLWEGSEDGGKSWKPKFDGIYTPRKPSK